MSPYFVTYYYGYNINNEAPQARAGLLRHKRKICSYKSRGDKAKIRKIYGRDEKYTFSWENWNEGTAWNTQNLVQDNFKNKWNKVYGGKVDWFGKVPVLLSDTVNIVIKACLLLKCTLQNYVE